MTNEKKSARPDANEILWFIAAACGFYIAPLLHSLGYIPAAFQDGSFFQHLGWEDKTLSHEQLALLTIAAYALHAVIFGSFTLGVSLGKMRYRSLCAVTALVSCSAWWLSADWQVHRGPIYPLYSNLFCDIPGVFSGLSLTSISAMVAACVTRIIQEFPWKKVPPSKLADRA